MKTHRHLNTNLVVKSTHLLLSNLSDEKSYETFLEAWDNVEYTDRKGLLEVLQYWGRDDGVGPHSCLRELRKHINNLHNAHKRVAEVSPWIEPTTLQKLAERSRFFVLRTNDAKLRKMATYFYSFGNLFPTHLAQEFAESHTGSFQSAMDAWIEVPVHVAGESLGNSLLCCTEPEPEDLMMFIALKPHP